jgi:NAD(P)-dependent dehydrogenase (short-subunit alcohol dehydrogenase family)
MKLKDKVVLITGAARGIGKGIAKEYAKEGASIILTDILPTLDNTRDEISKICQSRIISQKMDVRKVEDIKRIVKLVINEFGKIDILINNAGICIGNSVIDISEKEWDLIFDVNVKGVFNCSKVVVKEMIELGTKGKIINIASIMAKIGEPYTAAYTSSKHAVLGFTRCLAFEMAPYGINVNAICPGYINTEMERNLEIQQAKTEDKTFEEVRNFYINKVLFKRMGQPEDIAKVAVFLGSSESEYMTGQSINVCGGVIM